MEAGTGEEKTGIDSSKYIERTNNTIMKHYLNVCDVNGAEVEPVDVITFGSPCQDLSVAGKRAGLKHESNGDDETTRSGLFMEAVRIIKEMRVEDELRQLRSGRTDGYIRPRFAVWENVPGAFSSNKGEDFRVVLEELARIKDAEVSIPVPEKGKWKQSGEIVGDGWSIAWRTLDAQYHGVPQRRRRIFLVADFADECAGEILFECEGLPGYPSQSIETWEGTAGDSEKSIGRSGERECLIPYTLQIRSGCEGGGKGPLIQTDKSACLTAVQTQTLFQPMAYGICSYSSNSMKSGNPHSGIYEANTARTLDLNGGNPACNQGGICICEPMVMDMTHANDVLRIYEDGVVPCLQHRMVTDYKDATDLVVEKKCYSIDDTKMANTYVWEEQANTLAARDYKGPQAVCYQEQIGSLCARDYKGIGSQYVDEGKCIVEYTTKYIVRKLTPTECARLQGMPDMWCRLSQIEDMSDEDYEFWKQAHKTYAEINVKNYKEKTKKQMIAWYNKLQIDGSEYKAYGNGMALPCVRVPIHGIAQHGAKTMASLFDGIGGFPLAGLIDGIKTLWTSEIELFPIAVTIERFREYEKYGCFTFGYKGSNANLIIEKENKQMELKINEVTLPEQITFNYEELKQELTDKVSMYETLVYTDDQIKEAKSDKANLNKLKKALNDERIRLEKEYMTPFNDFKSKINEIISIIDKPVAVIDKQVKEFEEKKKQDKLDEITNFFNSTLHPDWMHLSQIMNEKWLNASVSMKSVKDDIDARLDQIENDLSTLNSLPEFGFEAQEVYKSSLDINKALNEGRRLSEIQKKKTEYEATQVAKLAEQMAEEKKQETFSTGGVIDGSISYVPEIGEAISPIESPKKQWISFSALLTTDDAIALKQFFVDRNIEFKAV